MLQIKNLQKEFQGFKLDCSFNITSDEVVGLVGRNGQGKTTIFRAILGMFHPDNGEVTLFGKPVTELTSEEKARIGVTFPNSFLSEEFTIQEIKRIMVAVYGLSFNASKFDKNCERLSLPMDKKIKNFSTGMQAKLKVLVAMSHEANFLLLDEPTSGLDVIVRNEILGMLQDYLDEKENRSILISSHISSDLEKLCDVILLIEDGKIILREETDCLLNDYGIIKVSEEEYKTLDKKFIVFVRKESYGYACLTKERKFYKENYPKIAIEKGSIDEIIILLTKEESS